MTQAVVQPPGCQLPRRISGWEKQGPFNCLSLRRLPFPLLLFMGISVAAPAVEGDARNLRYQNLLERYTPVVVQQLGRKTIGDALTRFDFDGNLDGYDNVSHAKDFPLPATVYGEVVAETIDAYYLFYGFYHPMDYDTPLREFFFASARHDNDFEGVMVAIDKPSGEILALETWFHNKFLQFTPEPIATGSETLDGKIHLEDQTHPILIIQSSGHGVSALQKIAEQAVLGKPFLIYRLGNRPTDVKEAETFFASYTLLPFQFLLPYALGPFERGSPFAAPTDFGLGPEPIGLYFSGEFFGNTSWARPKPPWSWCDKFDTLRPGAWFFHPAYVFNRHFQLNRSEEYLYNVVLSELFPVSQQTLDSWVSQAVPSYFNDIPQGPLHRPFRHLKRLLYSLAEYLFYWLG